MAAWMNWGGTTPPTIEGDAIKGSVGIPEGPTHGYAMVHELGHEGAYRITATRAKALAWQTSVKRNAQMAFALRPFSAPHFAK